MRSLAIMVMTVLLSYPPVAASSSCGWTTELYFEPGASGLTASQKAEILGVFEKLEETSKVLQVWTVGDADASEAHDRDQVFELSLRRAHAIRDYISRVRPEFKGAVGVDPRGYQRPMHPAGNSKNRRGEVHVTCPAYMAPFRVK